MVVGEGRGGDRRLPAVRLGWFWLGSPAAAPAQPNRREESGRVVRCLRPMQAESRPSPCWVVKPAESRPRAHQTAGFLAHPHCKARTLSTSDCGRWSWWTRRPASFSSEAPLNCRPERSFQEEVSLIQAGAAPGALCRPAAPNFFSNKQ